MTRNILLLILLATVATPASLPAEPSPSPNPPLRKNAKKADADKPLPKTDPAPSLKEGWNYVKGEWIHSDGYKYVKGQVIRIGAQTHKSAPKPPSKALLDSVKAKPTATPDPNSAAGKAAERERNLRQRPASQTGTHL